MALGGVRDLALLLAGDNRASDALSARAPPTIAPELASLSPRERNILALIGEGLTNRQIGKKFYLSDKTVKNHIYRLLAKLGVQRRVRAADLASHLEQPEAGERPRQ